MLREEAEDDPTDAEEGVSNSLEIEGEVAEPPKVIYDRKPRRHRTRRPTAHSTWAGKCIGSSCNHSVAGIGGQTRSLLAGLTTVEPLGINAVAEDEWVEVEATVDSGASETVMGEKTLNGVIGITEGPAFERGVKYECADREQIPNLGERTFLGFTEEGQANAVAAQVCAVNQTLMSVSKGVGCGNRVAFDCDGSYIENTWAGNKQRLQERNGLYYLKMWVSRRSSAEAGF